MSCWPEACLWRWRFLRSVREKTFTVPISPTRQIRAMPRWRFLPAIRVLESRIRLATCTEYLDQFSPAGFVALPEGSWGANSNNSVWLNEDTAWTWKHIYPAEMAVHQIANSGLWKGHEQATRLARQICRELLLLESSDWQFLITTKHARDYAEL